MNLNNLENLKGEMKNLGFEAKLIQQMEEKMTANLPDFRLHNRQAVDKGQVDYTLHFKQSGQSDYYYFNRFEASLSKGKPLAEDQKYMIITKTDQNKNVVKSMENVEEALKYFKEQKGTSELAVGRDAANKVGLANMENGKVTYVAKDFQRTFHSPPIAQNFYLERGKGFTAGQAANLLQGRSVYRDDLLNLAGEPYKAWIAVDTDKARDHRGNLQTRQFHDPAYGFNLKESLARYEIKELSDPKKLEKLENSVRNGDRPLITSGKEGQPVKLYLEAAVRYNNLNFYDEKGRPQKREQFEKEHHNELSRGMSADQSKAKKAQSELSIGR